MTSWSEQIQRRAEMIHAQIASLTNLAREYNLDSENALEEYYRILDQLYLDDLPLARAKDNSDLLLHIEGEAVAHDPRLSFVSFIFNNVKSQVRDLTKVVSGLRGEQRVTVNDIDLGLSGLAHGSLYLGFNVPFPSKFDGQDSLLRDQDPIYKATKKALKIIDKVSFAIVDVPDESVSDVAHETISDPKIRDAAMIAVQRMSPSGRKGIDSIGVSTLNSKHGAVELTAQTRSKLRKSLKGPIRSDEYISLEGEVREIDLDAKRFDLRRIVDSEIQDIRCVYSKIENVDAKKLIGTQVRVGGLVERRADTLPRLIQLDKLSLS